MTSVTVRQAALLTGKSRATINQATKSGDITYTKNKKGHKVIDISELSRVYEIVGTIKDIESLKEAKNKATKTLPISSEIAKEVSNIREEIIASQKRERELMTQQIELLQTTVDEIRKDKETYIRLLEDHSQNKEGNKEEIETLKKTNKVLSDRVDKLLMIEEKRAQDRMEARRKQRERLEREKEEQLLAEQNKTVWQKFFGKGRGK